jgi:hypothetical protein
MSTIHQRPSLTAKHQLASKLEVRYVRLGELQPSARNARQHSRIKIRQLANTIRTLRVLSAILVDESLENFAGARYERQTCLVCPRFRPFRSAICQNPRNAHTAWPQPQKKIVFCMHSASTRV